MNLSTTGKNTNVAATLPVGVLLKPERISTRRIIIPNTLTSAAVGVMSVEVALLMEWGQKVPVTLTVQVLRYQDIHCG